MIEYLGLGMLIAMAFNMWAWLSVMRSGTRLLTRAFWTILLVGLPGIGFVAWFLIGPRETHA